MRTEELNRLRWQCRRGLLELDVLLERFLEKHADRLQGEHLSSFHSLLTLDDSALWDLIRSGSECSDARLAEVVQWLRDCRGGTGSRCSADCKSDDDGARS